MDQINTLHLLAVIGVGIFVLLYLIIRRKLQPFVALVLVSVLIGLGAGMDISELIGSVNDGMRSVGPIALIIGLGAMFGAMLEYSGGGQRLAQSLVEKVGEARAGWALGLVGLLVCIPVFLDSAFIILVPLLYALHRKTGRPLTFFAIPLLAGMAVTHTFVPPTPGPIAVAGQLGADLGWVIVVGAIAGVPTMIVAGPLFGAWISRRVSGAIPEAAQFQAPRGDRPAPGVKLVLALIALPLVLIVCNTVASAPIAAAQAERDRRAFLIEQAEAAVEDAEAATEDGAEAAADVDLEALEQDLAEAEAMELPEVPEPGPVRSGFILIGEPFVALLITALLTFYLLGTRQGYSRVEVQEIATRALEPAGIIILITAGGLVLRNVLIDAGAGELFEDLTAASPVWALLVGWSVAAVIRVLQGSATVAMVTAAGLLQPLIVQMEFSPGQLALMVIALSSGATIASHVNDSGFWLVSRFLGLSVADTLKSWTVMETIIAVFGLMMVMLMVPFV